MAKNSYVGANVVVTYDTFAGWIEKTNQIIYDMAYNVVTTSPTANGDVTSGNGFVNGTFGSTTLVVTTGLRGGNTTSTGNLNIISNMSISNVNVTSLANTVYSNTVAYTGVVNYSNTVTYSSNVNFTGNNSVITFSNKTINISANVVANSIVADSMNVTTANFGSLSINSIAVGTANLSGNTYSGLAANSLALSGVSLSNLQLQITGNSATAYSNAVSYANVAATTAYSNAVSYANVAATTAYINAVSYATATFQTIAGLSSAVSGLTSNNTIYLNGTTLATLQTQISGNAATAYSNSASYTVAYTANAGFANSTNGKSISGGSGFVTGTNLGKTGSVGFFSNTSWTSNDWANMPIGSSGISVANTPGSPSNNYGYFIKVGNRDTGGGWGGLWLDYSSGDSYFGTTTSNSSFATWQKIISNNNISNYSANVSANQVTSALGYTPLHHVTSGYTGGQVFVSNTQPTATSVGDIWIQI